MNKRWFTLIIAALLVFLLANAAFGLEAFKVKSYITDEAGLLSESEASGLANALWKYNQATGNQLLVVTIPSLAGLDPTAFAEDLFSLNKPGQKGKDNGAILLIAKEERKIRIEVGYGLEPVLPDGKVGGIIRETISPYFQSGDYNSGIKAGLTAMVKAITPDYELAPEVAVASRPPAKDNNWPFAWLVAMIIFGISFIGNAHGVRNQQRRYRRGYSEPWLWGGGGGGGFGGGSSGGGGFSGGGGSFGGGGASGGW